jgi:hypothetical protein
VRKGVIVAVCRSAGTGSCGWKDGAGAGAEAAGSSFWTRGHGSLLFLYSRRSTCFSTATARMRHELLLSYSVYEGPQVPLAYSVVAPEGQELAVNTPDKALSNVCLQALYKITWQRSECSTDGRKEKARGRHVRGHWLSCRRTALSGQAQPGRPGSLIFAGSPQTVGTPSSLCSQDPSWGHQAG